MVSKIGNYIQPNQAYCNERNKIIPKAERLAQSRLGKHYTKDEQAYEFSRAMTELCEDAGLISVGNAELFHAKKIPFSKGFYGLGAR